MFNKMMGEICIKLLKILLMLVIAFSITGCASASPGNPTAKEILESNSDADIVKLDGLIYHRDTSSSTETEDEYSKGEKIGEIKKKTTNTWWFRNFYASKLPKGTEIFSTNEEYESGDAPFVIVAETDGELIEYQALVEG